MHFSRHFLAVVPCVLLAANASADFVINEVDADTAGPDADEYVELKGDPNQSVAGLTLVIYNGTGTAGGAPRAKGAYDLTGNANSAGYYVIGNTGVAGVKVVIPAGMIENGEDAVALYRGTSASAFAATNTSTATSPANAPGSLVDHCIWESGSDNTPNWSPFTMTALDEAAAGEPDLDSISRIPDGTGSFALGRPTPNAANIAMPAREVTASGAVNFGRTNEATVSTRTITLRNSGMSTMTVSAFGMAAGSDPEFSIIAGPDPALPASLARNQATTVVLQFTNSDVAANQVFTGAINYTTDAPTSGSGTIPVSAEFVRVLQTASVGDVVINEFSYNPNAGSAGGGVQDYNGDGVAHSTADEFIEIYNDTSSPLNIQGWEVNAKNGPGGNGSLFPYIFPVGATLPPGGYAVIFNAGTPTGFPAGVAYADGPGLSNSGATIEVTDGTTRLDGVAYLDAQNTPGFTNIPLTANGGSLGRRPDGSSNFVEFTVNGASAALRPSPGSTNGNFTAAGDWQLFQ